MKTQKQKSTRTKMAVGLRHGLGVLPNITKEQEKTVELFHKMLNGELPIVTMEITIPKNLQTDETKIKIGVDAFANIKYEPLLPKSEIKIFTCNHRHALALAIAAMLPQTMRKSLKFGNTLSCLAELLAKAGVKTDNNSFGKTNKLGFPDTISSAIFNGSLEATGVNKQTSSFNEPSETIKSQKSDKDEE